MSLELVLWGESRTVTKSFSDCLWQPQSEILLSAECLCLLQLTGSAPLLTMPGGLGQCWVRNRISLSIQTVTSSVTVSSEYTNIWFPMLLECPCCHTTALLLWECINCSLKLFYFWYCHFLMVLNCCCSAVWICNNLWQLVKE